MIVYLFLFPTVYIAIHGQPATPNGGEPAVNSQYLPHILPDEEVKQAILPETFTPFSKFPIDRERAVCCKNTGIKTSQ